MAIILMVFILWLSLALAYLAKMIFGFSEDIVFPLTCATSFVIIVIFGIVSMTYNWKCKKCKTGELHWHRSDNVNIRFGTSKEIEMFASTRVGDIIEIKKGGNLIVRKKQQ